MAFTLRQRRTDNFGSDAPVESPNPFYGLFAAVCRKKINNYSKGKSGWISNQTVTLPEALAAYTIMPPIVGGFGNIIGRMQVGFAADLVLLPSNFFSIDSENIQDLLPIATMSNGKWVYKNDKIILDFN